MISSRKNKDFCLLNSTVTSVFYAGGKRVGARFRETWGRMSQLSDCIQRGKIVTGPVPDAAKAKGINHDLIKSGTESVYLESFTPFQ